MGEEGCISHIMRLIFGCTRHVKDAIYILWKTGWSAG
jgi:hypothetical protein